VDVDRRRAGRGSTPPALRPARVYDHLKDAIITGTLRPLERITENKVAADFGLSRTPVREALQRLEAEGLIHVVPKRGSFISSPTVADILEIYQIRTPLEAACARVAAERIEESQLAFLDRLVRIEQERGPGHSPARSLRAAARFHAVIYGCSRNRRMANLLMDLQNQVHRVRVLWPSTVARLNDTWAEHAKIAAALRARDAAEAERLVVEHLNRARQTTLNRILPAWESEVSDGR
jgi:DNA-binding GntR family transcriptional regulator